MGMGWNWCYCGVLNCCWMYSWNEYVEGRLFLISDALLKSFAMYDFLACPLSILIALYRVFGSWVWICFSIGCSACMLDCRRRLSISMVRSDGGSGRTRVDLIWKPASRSSSLDFISAWISSVDWVNIDVMLPSSLAMSFLTYLRRVLVGSVEILVRSVS